MSFSRSLKSLGIAAGLVVLLATPAQAQIELGTSLANITFGLEDDSATVVGIPSGGFGILNPGLYASIFLGEKFAIEPQLGLILFNAEGIGTDHILNFNAQVDYFLRGNRVNSFYIFGGAGVINISDAGSSPTSVSAGAGYRLALGDRLTMRFDGRYTRFTEGGGSTVSVTASLGGMFGRR